MKEVNDKVLLLEIHQMLCKVCNYIDKLESPEYEKMRNDRSFSINVAADLYVDSLSRERYKKEQ